jgi:TatD DNase family protein
VSAVDAHTHLDLPAFDADRAEVLARAAAVGVVGGVICAADPADWDRVEAAGTSLGLPWTLGVHPWWCAALDDAAHDALLAVLSARPTPWGIGETGLDHGRATTPGAQALQRRSLRAHLALARERDVPVVLHVVRAYPEALDVIDADGLPAAGGMVHSWSGPPELVPRAVALGLHLSFCAAFTRSRRVARALAATPGERLLLETDAPDQPLDPGARGEPADLVRIAVHAAAVRGEAAELLLARSAAAVRALFGWGTHGSPP